MISNTVRTYPLTVFFFCGKLKNVFNLKLKLIFKFIYPQGIYDFRVGWKLKRGTIMARTNEYQTRQRQAIVEYLDSLSLRSEFEEDPDEYVGMTWVIAVDHADGSTVTVYHFGNMFIRNEDGPWYRMEYEEAERFHALLDELNGE